MIEYINRTFPHIICSIIKAQPKATTTPETNARNRMRCKITDPNPSDPNRVTPDFTVVVTTFAVPV